MKCLQMITLLCSLAGIVMGLDIMFRLQPGRDAGESTANTFTVHTPSFDANGEPN